MFGKSKLEKKAKKKAGIFQVIRHFKAVICSVCHTVVGSIRLVP